MTKLYPIPYRRRWGDNPAPRYRLIWVGFALGVLFSMAVVGGTL